MVELYEPRKSIVNSSLWMILETHHECILRTKVEDTPRKQIVKVHCKVVGGLPTTLSAAREIPLAVFIWVAWW